MVIALKPSTIIVSPKTLKFGVDQKKYPWWNFDRMIRTWEILDTCPNTPIEELPLFSHQWDVFEKWLHEEPELNRVRRSVEIHRDLYFDIRDKGYRNIEKQITVRINADGVIRVGDGHHRASMLKHLGYNEVEVVVKSRHPSFMKFKQNLYSLYGKKFLYQPVDHPDFLDWEVNVAPCRKVLNFISSNIDVAIKTVLDVGCCTGWFSYMLARRGAEVTGIDVNSKRIKLAEYQRTYREAKADNPTFINQSLQKHLQENIHYDVTLLLNVIHHYLRKDVSRAMKMIKQISRHTDTLVIQTSTKIPISIGDFIEKVMRRGFTYYLTQTFKEHPSRPVLLFKK